MNTIFKTFGIPIPYPLPIDGDWVRIHCGVDGQPNYIFGIDGLKSFYEAGAGIYSRGKDGKLEYWFDWYDKEKNERIAVNKSINEIKGVLRSKKFRMPETDISVTFNRIKELMDRDRKRDVLSFIETKIKQISWQDLKIGDMPMPEVRIRNKKQKQPVIKTTVVRYVDSFDLLDLLAHPYGQILLGHATNDNETVSLSEEDHPGIFKFVKAGLYKRFFYLLEKVDGIRCCGSRAMDFIEQASFYFQDETKTIVEIYFNNEFRHELKRGFFDKYIKEHEPKLIDINLFDDVKQPSEEEIRKSELEDQRYQRFLGLQAENLFS